MAYFAVLPLGVYLSQEWSYVQSARLIRYPPEGGLIPWFHEKKLLKQG